MDVFLGRSSFAHAGEPCDGPPESFVGQARFSGVVSVCNWPRREVAALLPADLALAANASMAPDLHPVVFIFGEQADGATFFGNVRFPWPIRYGEFGLAVPFVMLYRGSSLYTFIPRMYSSYFPAVWHGNAHFGFSKEMATMRWEPPLFVMTSDRGRLLFHAAVEDGGDWWPATAGGPPNLGAVREMFACPILGRKAAGTWVVSYFAWDFSDSLVRATNALISIDGPILPALRPRTDQAVAGGAFEVRDMLWSLSWPSVAGR
jgi:hypothetical protein